MRILLPCLLLMVAACGDDDDDDGSGCAQTLAPGEDDQTALQIALIEVAEGDTICLTEGTFSFHSELGLDVGGVTLRGAGSSATLLDFTGQDAGAQGMLIRADGVTIEGLEIKNTEGDAIKATEVTDIRFADVSVVWDADESVDNGAYGLYPVGSSGVVIERCKVKGARDAGIYVGQSTNIHVTGNEAFGNVAGIEIENSTDAIVDDNHAHDNTGGILVFNLPGLPVPDGRRANVFDNVVENNNVPNFASPGTTVANLPRGTGMMILAADENELWGNTITGNESVGILLISYVELLFGAYDDPAFDPFPQGNFIHDNTFAENGENPEAIVDDFVEVDPIPDIAWDGCEDADADNADGSLTNCLSENGDADYIDIDLCGGLSEASQDMAPVTCEHEALPTS